MSRITAADRVYDAVYGEIQTEVLPPGTSLREDLLARQYGLSRTPVREALRRLVQDGLAEKRGAGLRVARPTLPQVHEIYPIVSVLEGLAARLCAEQLEQPVLLNLGELHTAMEGMGRAGDHSSYVATNQRFHDIILDTSGNANLVATVQRLRVKTSALRRYQLGVGSRMHQSCNEHAELLAAFCSRDGPAAELAMRRHVEAGHHILVTALSSTALFEPDLDAPREKPAPTFPTTENLSVPTGPVSPGTEQRRM